MISWNGDVNQPPRWSDLTLLDYFLWYYVKNLIYNNNLELITRLKDEMIHVISDVEQFCQNEIENFNKRVHIFVGAGGGHLKAIFCFKNTISWDVNKKNWINNCW